MEPSNTAELLSRIERALLPLTAARAALLFGSHAAGRARSDSDVDIAVLLSPASATALRKPMIWELFAALGRELPSRRLDVVVLNDAAPKLAFRVLQEGRVAFERDPVDLHRLRVRTYSRQADHRHVERFFRDVPQPRGSEPRGSEPRGSEPRG